MKRLPQRSYLVRSNCFSRNLLPSNLSVGKQVAQSISMPQTAAAHLPVLFETLAACYMSVDHAGLFHVYALFLMQRGSGPCHRFDTPVRVAFTELTVLDL